MVHRCAWYIMVPYVCQMRMSSPWDVYFVRSQGFMVPYDGCPKHDPDCWLSLLLGKVYVVGVSARMVIPEDSCVIELGNWWNLMETDWQLCIAQQQRCNGLDSKTKWPRGTWEMTRISLRNTLATLAIERKAFERKKNSNRPKLRWWRSSAAWPNQRRQRSATVRAKTTFQHRLRQFFQRSPCATLQTCPIHIQAWVYPDLWWNKTVFVHLVYHVEFLPKHDRDEFDGYG